MLEGISMGQGLQEDLSKHDGKEALTGHLEELIEAASMLLEKIDSRRNLYGVERENADSKHEELIMQIEEEIKRLNEVENSFNVQAILEPLLAAIKDLDLDFGHERHRRTDTQDSEDEVHDVNEVDETRPTTADDQSRPASAITGKHIYMFIYVYKYMYSMNVFVYINYICIYIYI
jgi:adenosine deaminase